MRIEVVAGTGVGPTELAAFDAAEMEMGVANCNLIRLSSLIPPGAEVAELTGAVTSNPGWGDKLYCVYAEKRESRPKHQAWAGLGWFMINQSKGLFCEHDGGSREAVEDQIRASLTNFMKIRGIEPDESLIKMKVAGITCQDQPVCAMVLGAYQAEGWKTDKQ